MVAVQGAITFQPVVVYLQVLALVADGVRVLYLQATMQARTDTLDPINMLDRVAPIASALLLTAGSIAEFPSMHLKTSRRPCSHSSRGRQLHSCFWAESQFICVR